MNYKLQDPVLQPYQIPSYPPPPGAIVGSGRTANSYQMELMNIANKIHDWTQRFEGGAIKQMTPQDEVTIKTCLNLFAPVDNGLTLAFEREEMSLEGLYQAPSHRRILVEHIIALDIYVSVFLPFYVGLDMAAGKVLVSITDDLYKDRKSHSLNR